MYQLNIYVLTLLSYRCAAKNGPAIYDTMENLVKAAQMTKKKLAISGPFCHNPIDARATYKPKVAE